MSFVCSERLTVSYVTCLIYPLFFFAEDRKDTLYITGFVCVTVFCLVISIVVLKIRKPCLQRLQRLQRELCSKSLNQADILFFVLHEITGKIEILKMFTPRTSEFFKE